MNISQGRIQRALYAETALPSDELTGVPLVEATIRDAGACSLTAGSGSVHVLNVHVSHQPITDWLSVEIGTAYCKF